MPAALDAFGDGGLTSVLRPHKWTPMQTKSAAEMTVATCSNLGFKNRSHCLLMLCIIHRHRHFNSKGLKREVADAGTRLCATFVVPLQRGEMR